MPKRIPVLVLRCDLGDPVAGAVVNGARTPDRPLGSVYQEVVGPQGRRSLLRFWRDASLGHLDLRGSRLSPVLGIDVADVVDADSPRDGRGDPEWRLSRGRMLAAALAAARARGVDTQAFTAFVVVVRQGRLRFGGREVAPFTGGAVGTAAIVPIGADHFTFAHEIGHALGFPHTWGVRTPAWGWFDPPFDLTREYGDPFCVTGRVFAEHDSAWLERNPVHVDWPGSTFTSPGAAPALATVHVVWPGAPAEDRCVRRLAHEEWTGGAPRPFRLHPAGDRTPGRAKLVVLEGSGPPATLGPGEAGPPVDPRDTYYVEYRPRRGWDRSLVTDPAHRARACPAVVVHQLRDTSSCVPPRDREGRRVPGYDSSLPACARGEGADTGEGRLRSDGVQLHFRARVPVPGPLSADWHDGASPYLRVVDAAPDHSWVDVVVGPPVRSSFRDLLPLGVPSMREVRRERLYGGRDRITAPCFPQGMDSAFWVDAVTLEQALGVEPRGYGGGTGPTGDDPALSWTVAGRPVRVPAIGEPDARGTVVGTARVQRYEGGVRPTVRDGVRVSLDFVVRDDGLLVLRNRPEDGNYQVDVAVSAVDADGDPATRRERSRTLVVQGQALTLSGDVRDAVSGCLDDLLERAHDLPLDLSAVPRPRPEPWLERDDLVRLGRASTAYRRLTRSDPHLAGDLAHLVRLRYGVEV
ncbi:hypothetical protein [Actinorugispora endophytica]|uniref:Uncharacterized protein n=1 Tax=Actinorugispora endophytica TaxID=1605990 RepID=A0A4R6V4E2_9ACTN|nr:hypothetical protein [Actinorugispora endophytica]TDQ53732.1 hypothetical protein EV190_103183 [Actinorugispora endophytica]